MNFHILVLVYHQFENFKRFLSELLASSLSKNSKIWVVENRSINTDKKFAPMLKELLSRKLIYKYVCFQENIANSAVQIVLEEFSEELFENEYIIITDGDINFDCDASHQESVSILKRHPGNDFCSLRLDTKNLPIGKCQNTADWFPEYIPSCCHYIGHGGIHFSHLRCSNLKEYTQFAKENQTPFLDSDLNRFLQSKCFTPCITRSNTALHLTWNDYSNLSSYFVNKEKLPSDLWTKFKSAGFDLHE